MRATCPIAGTLTQDPGGANIANSLPLARLCTVAPEQDLLQAPKTSCTVTIDRLTIGRQPVGNQRGIGQTMDKTLDLGEIAQLRDGEQVEVRRLGTDEDVFAATLELLQTRVARQRAAATVTTESAGGPVPAVSRPIPATPAPTGAPDPADVFIPQDEQLRSVFLFAEAVGGYQQLHDLVYKYSPGLSLIARVRDTVAEEPLRPLQARDLRDYKEQIVSGLEAAQAYLTEHGAGQFSDDDREQLFTVLSEAQHRANEIDRILGINMVHELEAAVQRLYELRETMRAVDQSVSGIFMVADDVLFLPTEELMGIINTLFRGLGNPHLANHVSGITLLAARNLLIQVVAFYSYYGRHQIYNTLRRAGATVSTRSIASMIRGEINRVFSACQHDNRLVLRKVMREASEDFELSIDAICREAEASAIDAVKAMMPKPAAPKAKRKRAWWRRLLGIR